MTAEPTDTSKVEQDVPPSHSGKQSGRNDSSPRKSRSRMVALCSVLLAFAVVGVFFLFGVLIGSIGSSMKGDSQTTRLRETLIDGDSKEEKKIAMLAIRGVIMESMGAGRNSVTEIVQALKALREDENVVGVLLAIDTPGGGVTASDRIYHELKRFKEDTGLPVHALFLDVAASGGYYVAMASDHITAHPTTITGSIGVISQFYQLSEAMDKIGVSVNVVKSLRDDGTASFKDIGSPYRPMTAEERDILQGLITEMWDRFTEVVATGRAESLSSSEVKALADGRVFTGTQALALGLVDAVGYSDDAYAAIRVASGESKAKIVSYRRAPTLKESLGFGSHLEGLNSEFTLTGSALRQALIEQARFCYLWTASSL